MCPDIVFGVRVLFLLFFLSLLVPAQFSRSARASRTTTRCTKVAAPSGGIKKKKKSYRCFRREANSKPPESSIFCERAANAFAKTRPTASSAYAKGTVVDAETPLPRLGRGRRIRVKKKNDKFAAFGANGFGQRRAGALSRSCLIHGNVSTFDARLFVPFTSGQRFVHTNQGKKG